MEDPVEYVVVKDVASRTGESLGYLIPGSALGGFVRVGILAAPAVDPLRGPISVQEADLRPATREDFDRFRVAVPESFERKPRGRAR